MCLVLNKNLMKTIFVIFQFYSPVKFILNILSVHKFLVEFARCTDNNQPLGVLLSNEWFTIDTDCKSAVVYDTGL